MHTVRLMTAFILFAGSLAAEWRNEDCKTQQNSIIMDTSKLNHPIVKAAFEAWQKGDAQVWLSWFTPDAQLLDDGHPRNFQEFSTEAIGHEHFTSIDIVKDRGLSIYGKFHSDYLGQFQDLFQIPYKRKQ